MNRIELINQRYAASSTVARTGVELIAVGDPAGARFNGAVRRLIAVLRDDGPGIWDELAAVSKALRWRLITQPHPMAYNPGLIELAGQVERYALRLRGAVTDEELLNDLAESAAALAHPDRESVVGTALLRSCLEVGPEACVVIAASKPARLGLEQWLGKYEIRVRTTGELEQEPGLDQSYVVGPPRFYRSSLVTAPVTEGISFVLPAWFGDRSIPQSAIASYAEGAIRVAGQTFSVGDVTEPDRTEAAAAPTEEDAYLPQPVWGPRKAEDREPTTDEVVARKVLLGGGLAMWLDDGERIRSLEPRQPAGERVTYTEVGAVRPGTYLLLRQGVTERRALYQAALAKLGPRAASVNAAQSAWKQVLAQRLGQHGYRRVVKDLRAAGVRAAERARAWTSPALIRPISDKDFEVLLQWLGTPVQPTFGYASLLRRMLYQASTEIGKQLEAAVSAADLTELETSGHLSLDVKTEGFRGILATKVLAISPFTEIVPRHDARVPFVDRSGQWLE